MPESSMSTDSRTSESTVQAKEWKIEEVLQILGNLSSVCCVMS